MSGSDPTLVFAAGRLTGGMVIDVVWRSGKISRIPEVKPNRVYEIEESEAGEVQSSKFKVQGKFKI